MKQFQYSFSAFVMVMILIGLVCLNIQHFQYKLNENSIDQLWLEINFNTASYMTTIRTRNLLKPEWALVGSDPKTYKGQIVKGWPPGKSRNMSEIMTKDYVIEQCLHQDLSGVKLFIGVKTVSTRFEERDTTRETWASFQNDHPDVKVMFFLGEMEDSQLKNQLRLEIQTHCDLVIVHGLETYENVTMKTVSILSYIHDQQLGLNPEVSMIIDDDSYLNLDRLHYLTSHRLLSKPMDVSLTGFVFGGKACLPIAKVCAFPNSLPCVSWKEL